MAVNLGRARQLVADCRDNCITEHWDTDDIRQVVEDLCRDVDGLVATIERLQTSCSFLGKLFAQEQDARVRLENIVNGVRRAMAIEATS